MSLVTNSGTEINIQKIVRFEEDYLVLRGRLAGSTDTGRAFFVPFEQIDYLALQKELREEQIVGFFVNPSISDSEPSAATEEASNEAKPDEEPFQEAATEVTPAAPAQLPSRRAANLLNIPNRSGLIARLRARQEQAKRMTPPSP